MAKGELTRQQRQLAVEYLIDLNATQAAIRAGYAAESANRAGSRLLSNVDIRTEIDWLIAERAAKVELDAARVLLHHRDSFERATAAGDFKAVARLVELMGRHCGLFPTRIVMEFEGLTDDQLDAEITRLQAATGRAAGGESPPDRCTPAAAL